MTDISLKSENFKALRDLGYSMGEAKAIVDALLDTTKKRIELFCELRLNNGTSAYELLKNSK
jgi:Holliday junction resolvasome RuvABC DNA-binding subunit